jgi:APA family basic amino acid/polyamine antiporter
VSTGTPGAQGAQGAQGASAVSGRDSRKFGFWMASALVVGNVIGAGLFLLPATLAPYGWVSVAGWLITLVGALCLAWVFAQLSRYLPHAGGAFGFMRLAHGDGPAFVGAWGYWVSIWVANAAIATGAISYLSRLVPSVENTAGVAPILTCGVIWLLTWVNLRGVRTVGWVQMGTTIVKLLPFVAVFALIIVRLASEGTSAVAPFDAGALTLGGATAAATLTLYSLLGLESAAIPADRVTDPARTVPAATMFGTWLTGIVSVVCCSAVVLMLPSAEVASSTAPFALFIGRAWGDGAAAFVALCAVVSCYGALNGWVLLAGELPAAMADAGRLPAWFGVRNARGAPVRAVILSSVLTSVLVLLNFTSSMAAVFTFAILLATATNLVLYLLCAVGAVRLMRSGAVPHSRMLLAAAVGATVFSVWALYGAGREALLWGMVLLLAGWPVFIVAARTRAAAARSSP